MNIVIDGCFKTNSNASNFFSRRVAGYWNKIPSHVKTAPSVHVFKGRSGGSCTIWLEHTLPRDTNGSWTK